MQQKSFRYRIYPTKPQQEFLAQHFGSVRFVYNYFLDCRKQQYAADNTSRSYYDDCKLLTELKQQDGYNWLNEINAQTLQASLRNLDRSHTNVFKKRAKFPKFHSRKNKQCIKIPQAFKIKGGKLFIVRSQENPAL